MSPLRKTAFAAGALYLLSFVSIPTLFLYNPLRASNYILGHGSNTGIIVGAILEMIVALAGIGTAVALFPVVKRQNEGVALGFVGTRTLEGGALLAGAACVLSLVTLQQAGAGTNGMVMGHTLISMYDRIFLLGGSFMPAVNALLIGSLLYQSRLVPRWLPLLGFVGATLLVAGDGAIIFGLIGQHAATTPLFAIPIALRPVICPRSSGGYGKRWSWSRGSRPVPIHLARHASAGGSNRRRHPDGAADIRCRA